MKADPLSVQIEIETCSWDVLLKRLKTEDVVDNLVDELKAQLHHVQAPKWT